VSLTPKQAAFVEEYLVDLNGTQAAIRAGYSAKTANVTSSKLLAKANVAEAVARATMKRSARTEITADRVLTELAKLAFSNMADYVRIQDDGTAYVDLSDLTPEQTAAIQEIVTDEYTEGRGEDAAAVKKIKFKLADKRGALELLGKHLALFTDRLQVEARFLRTDVEWWARQLLDLFRLQLEDVASGAVTPDAAMQRVIAESERLLEAGPSVVEV
jgi:phage terminase small subunit